MQKIDKPKVSQPDGSSQIKPLLYNSSGHAIVPSNSTKPTLSRMGAVRRLWARVHPLQPAWRLATATATVVTILAGCPFLVPWIRVEASETYNHLDPYGTYFTINNQSPLAIRDLEVGCGHLLLFFGYPKTLNGFVNNTFYGNPDAFWIESSGVAIPPYGQHSVRCREMMTLSIGPLKVPPQRIRYVIQSKFKVWGLPWVKLTRLQKFDSFRDTSGYFHWVPVSKWEPPQPDFR
jgi:hypothetical protein